MSWLYLILDFLILVLAILWISKDITERSFKKKYYWIWMIGLLVAYFLFQLIGIGFLGIAVVVLSYYLWRRYLFEKDKNKRE